MSLPPIAPEEPNAAPAAGTGRERTRLQRVLWILGWPVRFVLLILIRGYRRFISPLTPPSCRYHPCCSSYGLTAIERHGAAKGTALTAWRLVRCNPWSGGGVDPVPPPGRWLPDVHPDGAPRRRSTV